MAQIGAVHSVGEGIARHLTGAYAQERNVQATLSPARRTLPECRFEQLAGARFDSDFKPGENLVTLYLYRLGIDKNLRSSSDARHPRDPKARPLSLELHYLITAWAADAAAEQTMLSWTMLELHRSAHFDRAALLPAALWDQEESILLQPSEMSHEDMMRIWDAVVPGYRLSVSYVARSVRLETGLRENAGPVVATRMDVVPLAEVSDA